MLTCSLNKNQPNYVAVSGGVDSIAAAYYLACIRRFPIIVVHFNHNYQDANDAMENTVRKFCNDLDIKIIVGKAKSGLKNESEFRNERIKFFFENCSNRTLVTAHHLNDFVESYLINCFRGNPEYFPIPIETEFENGNRIIHPFLLKPKTFFQNIVKDYEIEKYIVDDPTNYVSKGSRRNMIRNKIIPILNEEQIGLEKICKKKILQKIKRLV